MDWGILHLPVSPGELPPQMWADVSMNRILTVLMLVVGLLALRDYFRLHVSDQQDEDYELIPNSYKFQAKQVQYDSLKPCYWQQLVFMCETNPD